MNDRYLYRAKRKNWRELPKEVWWVEGYYAFVDNHHYIYTGNLCNGGLYVVAERLEIDIATLCACTGLKDKNGNLIWENDIVKKHFYTDYDNYANSEEYIGFVKYEDCAWVIKTKRDNGICTRPIIESMAYSDDIKHFEVIGNRFDNPELLEVGE